MAKVKLPPGCVGFDTADGRKLTADRPGGTLEVSDTHARAINQGQYGSTGLVSARDAMSFGTKRGQACPDCGRLWNAWNFVCPKCGTETESV